MTKKLETLLNLPDNKEDLARMTAEKKTTETRKRKEEKESQAQSLISMADFDKIANALPHVTGLAKKADDELDDIAGRALSAYESLMDLGMNVEARYSGRVFEVAGRMLDTTLSAKVAKIDKKLKMVELQLKKERNEADAKRKSGNKGGDVQTGAVVLDRNELLKQLKGDLDK
jgi:hypothetical protein|tara:strand:- start:2055 stop:2573 length:519 start_codon:yes stop_codon:yes gene_type:complete